MAPFGQIGPILLVATAQMAMKWTVEENCRAIIACIQHASNAGAGMILFPELAVTGFHRKIVEETQKLIQDSRWVEAIRSCCRDNAIHAWIGLPTFAKEQIYNSYILLDANGELVCESQKEGLTESEKRLFSAGAGRPMHAVNGRKFAAVLCREVADLDHLAGQLQGSETSGLVWPGFISHEPEASIEVTEGTTDQAAFIAKTLGCEIIQCNWANSLNKPQMTDLGGRGNLNKLGEVVWSCPRGTPGIGFVDLDSRQCHWDSTFF